MLNYFRNRWASRFIRMHTTTKLTDLQAMGANVEELISTASKQFLAKHNLLDSITAKIDKLLRLDRLINIYGFVLSLILAASILGVKLEISLLGISLSDFGKLKELGLVVFIGLNLLYDAVTYETLYLDGLRKKIATKLYGENNTKVLETVYIRHNFSYPVDNLDSKNLSMIPQPLRIVHLFCVMVLVMVVIAGALSLQIIVAQDVWINSNLPSPWNKLLVILFGISFLTALYSLALRDTLPSTYRDKGKDADFNKLRTNDAAYKEAIHDFLKKERK